ncbi:nucleotidyltransferase domain-containing protein [Candidatus Woesearchaeota archaeon]|nr:nucleotidyltransferase domain-containing protein [Candidatus Woesearchaeota archaeon]
MKSLPKKYLATRERKEMWKDAKRIIEKVDKSLNLSEIHVVGSFVSKKKKPQDIDFAIVTKVKSKKSNPAYPVDLIILPENEDIKEYLDFLKKYMKKKYGKDVKPVKLK